MNVQNSSDLAALLKVLPPHISELLHQIGNLEGLLEVVLDLGRVPEARFLDQEVVLCKQEITALDIQQVVSRISEFDADNRAGIERTLHRISAIRNRRGDIVGLTCRIGRAIDGTIDIIQDIILSGKNILLMGRPGVGKTTMLREAARVLAEQKRVVIVDTSNEIGGDGDIPHPAVGRARRMQVGSPSLQHEVMIEAVENHMPQVIIIDEIGRELETLAARTIAERGVQLVATAHGNTLNNLMLNPTLCDLVGGIESVTLSDEEARRRRTQKTVLERRAPPTFEVVVEIQSWDRVAVHTDVAKAVDGLLRNQSQPPMLRHRDDKGQIHAQRAVTDESSEADSLVEAESGTEILQHMHIYPYGVARNRLNQVLQKLVLPVTIADDLEGINAVITLKTHYRDHPKVLTMAEDQGIPIYVLRSNTIIQIEKCLLDIFGLVGDDELSRALREMRNAIRQVTSGVKMVELAPQNAYIRRRQHQLARECQLISHSRGKEPYRRVRLYRE